MLTARSSRCLSSKGAGIYAPGMPVDAVFMIWSSALPTTTKRKKPSTTGPTGYLSFGFSVPSGTFPRCVGVLVCVRGGQIARGAVRRPRSSASPLRLTLRLCVYVRESARITRPPYPLRAPPPLAFPPPASIRAPSSDSSSAPASVARGAPPPTARLGHHDRPIPATPDRHHPHATHLCTNPWKRVFFASATRFCSVGMAGGPDGRGAPPPREGVPTTRGGPVPTNNNEPGRDRGGDKKQTTKTQNQDKPATPTEGGRGRGPPGPNPPCLGPPVHPWREAR